MIEFKNVFFKTIDTKTVLLNDINLSIKKGEKIIIYGRSGSGKSILGYHLAGIHKKILLGETYGELLNDNKKIGMVFQNPENQLLCKTPFEEIMLSLGSIDLSRQEKINKADQILSEFELSNYKKINTNTLSLGLKQRLSIASMIAISPELLILDEPSNYLDRNSAINLFQLLDRINIKNKITIVVIEHESLYFKDWGTKYIKLDKGEIVSISSEYKENKQLSEHIINNYSNSSTLLNIKDLDFSYDNKILLKKCNLEVKEGDIITIKGTNGTGKTTLLKLIKGILKPQKGKIVNINDTEVLIGYQNPDEQIFSHSVIEECSFLLKNKKIKKIKRTKLALKSLKNFDIINTKKRSPFTLSYGEKRRLSLAGIFLIDKSIICLDEPTVALDKENVELLKNIIFKESKKGSAIIIATHDDEFCEYVSNRRLVIEKGKLDEQIF